MTQIKILEELQRIFSDVLSRAVHLTLESSAQDVKGWDSLSHITLVLEVEAAFKIQFVTGEVESTRNIGEWIKLIETRLTA